MLGMWLCVWVVLFVVVLVRLKFVLISSVVGSRLVSLFVVIRVLKVVFVMIW